MWRPRIIKLQWISLSKSKKTYPTVARCTLQYSSVGKFQEHKDSAWRQYQRPNAQIYYACEVVHCICYCSVRRRSEDLNLKLWLIVFVSQSLEHEHNRLNWIKPTLVWHWCTPISQNNKLVDGFNDVVEWCILYTYTVGFKGHSL